MVRRFLRAISNRISKWFLNKKYWMLHLLEADGTENPLPSLVYARATANMANHILTNITLLFQFY